MTFPRIADQHNYQTGTDGFVIETAEGKFWDGGFGRPGYAFYENRDGAQRAIDDREYVAVRVIPFTSAVEREIGLTDDYGSDENAAKLGAWLEANDCFYFAAEKEDCFEWAAIREARKAGKTAVIMENLS